MVESTGTMTSQNGVIPLLIVPNSIDIVDRLMQKADG